MDFFKNMFAELKEIFGIKSRKKMIAIPAPRPVEKKEENVVKVGIQFESNDTISSDAVDTNLGEIDSTYEVITNSAEMNTQNGEITIDYNTDKTAFESENGYVECSGAASSNGTIVCGETPVDGEGYNTEMQQCTGDGLGIQDNINA